MKYEDYKLEDFLNDDYFVEWVKQPSAECDYFWKQWLSKHPEKSKTIGLAKEIILGFQYSNTYEPTYSEKVEILEKIVKDTKHRNFPFFKTAMKIAASIAIIFGITFLVNSFDNTTEQVVVSVEDIEKSTAFGEKKTVILPDGSAVKLNYGSRIKYQEGFSDTFREVELVGEAFFDVKPNPDRPFVINTQNVKTIVLGTSFNVSAFADRDEISVVVVSGKVRVQNHANGGSIEDVILLPNEMMSLNKISGRMLKEKCDVSAHIEWRDGMLIFRKATFEEVIDELERWYGVDINVAADLNIGGRFNGSFKNYSLEHVLKGLSFSNLIDYELNNKIVTISKKYDDKH
ncbi:MAG: FecR domain-containing protein [Cyclobacteriaceae bacterium]